MRILKAFMWLKVCEASSKQRVVLERATSGKIPVHGYSLADLREFMALWLVY